MDISDLLVIFGIVSPIVWKFVDFFKLITSKNWSGVITQSIVWLGGIALIILLAGADFADTIGVGQWTLSKLNAASLIFIGLAGGSAASGLYDFKAARDNKDTAAMPALVPTLTEGATASNTGQAGSAAA